MTLSDLKTEILKYQYFEDTNIIDVALASIIATRLNLGDPVWLIIIGASSGGKSQILRPLAITDEKFLHKVDDLTENTFLSGMNLGKEKSPSLLHRIGSKGIIVMSDLTVLFSKSGESKSAIFSQFRMIYDGEMVKYSGTSDKPISWKGSLGVLAGSTPTIYSHFEEVADMGQRFIYYRMKDFDPEKATRLALNREIFGKELDQKLSDMYAEYIKDVVTGSIDNKNISLPEFVNDRIIYISMFAEKIRTVAHMDWEGKIDKIPVPAMPMRVALQLISIAKGLYIMRGGNMTETDLDIIDWCGYSLANEEKRACLRVLAGIDYGLFMSTQTIADKIGLATSIIGNILQNLGATGVVTRTGTSDGLMWSIKDRSHYDIVRKIEGIKDSEEVVEREVTTEEEEEYKRLQDKIWEDMSNDSKGGV